MRILVLGAGVVGVSSAWYLQADGHEVTVIDRQPGAGLETSFANGGQISVSHAEPWASPMALKKAIRWLGQEDAPLLWRWGWDPARWAWGSRFLAECRPALVHRNIAALVSLGLFSRTCLKELRERLNLEYGQQTRGILHIYRDERDFHGAARQAALMRDSGCNRIIVSARECLAIEPALGSMREPVVGGTYTQEDESGDAHVFTRELATRCVERGVRFCFNTDIRSMAQEGGRIVGGVMANGQHVPADAIVVALGSYTPYLLRPLGIGLPIYPAKGYSITIPLQDGEPAPFVSLIDEARKLVFSRLGDRLRVAGTAEFCGYDLALTPARYKAVARGAYELFPHLDTGRPISPWAGLRPATPSNRPIVGCLKFPNLFVNAGHGTLGWTLACGSGRMLADLVSGRVPAVDPKPFQWK